MAKHDDLDLLEIYEPDQHGTEQRDEAASPGPSSNPRPSEKRQLPNLENQQRKAMAHPLIDAECGCEVVCSGKISSERRAQLNCSYWEMPLEARRLFILQHSARKPVKRRRKKKAQPGQIAQAPRKMFSYVYNLDDDQAVGQTVCVKFFLNTLGYSTASSNFIYRTHEDAVKKQFYTIHPKKQVKENPLVNVVKLDILSYCTTNYDSPQLFRLPSDVSCKQMVECFNANRRNKSLSTCSYSFYHRQLGQMKKRLVEEEHALCDDCTISLPNRNGFDHGGHPDDEYLPNADFTEPDWNNLEFQSSFVIGM